MYTPKPATPEDIEVSARTVWGEARGEGWLGMEAVAWVIANRWRSDRWNQNLSNVCFQPLQFSCWNPNDPNLPKLRVVDHSDRLFSIATIVSLVAVMNETADPTFGADHYHSVKITPEWDYNKLTRTMQVGNHVFYKHHK
jgi:spore germination cell wall hydrolase CwlJ-like protein